jgi:hypothetical protein
MPFDVERGVIFIDGVRLGEATDITISDYTEDTLAGEQYIRENCSLWCNDHDVATLNCVVKYNIITYLKIIGLWDWVKTSCPNKRLTYLMEHGKNTRVRMKNFRRAAREIDKHILWKGERK